MTQEAAPLAPMGRFRRWLQADRLEHAYLTNPVSIAYLTGFRTEPAERVMALAIAGDLARLLVPALEEDSATEAARGVEVVVWRDGEDPYRPLEPLLNKPSALAVEKDHLSLARAEVLQGRFGPGRLVDAGPVIRELRAVKDHFELERLANAARVTDRVAAAALAGLRPGMTELEVSGLVANEVASAGARLSFETIVQSGPNSAMPHLRPGGRRLQPGDLVLLDLGAFVDGYHGDITRMAVLGQPTARQQEVHDAVLRAHDAAIAAIRPGIAAGDVDAAARQVLTEVGLGDNFVHRVGHGLGMQGHEAPSLDPGSQLTLAEGMVMTVEPGAYITGWGGVRIEDDVVVTGGGSRRLTELDNALVVVGAS